MNHPDSDGEWTPSEAKKLDVELSTIAKAHVKEEGLTPKTLLECFFEVSGEPLLEHLRDLCACSVERGLPIQFQ